MAQFFNKSANNIARISMVLGVVLAGTAFYAYTQIARSSYLTGRYLESSSRYNSATSITSATTVSIAGIVTRRSRRRHRPVCRRLRPA